VVEGVPVRPLPPPLAALVRAVLWLESVDGPSMKPTVMLP